uniref:RING-type E3 ubiquitin transferase n=1 Tax=Otus sunia TaxID=257818 RepID=A0A8C8EC48_9STRI
RALWPAPHVPNMASASDDRCPICLNTCDNAALTMPCLHRVCFSCVWQWAEIKVECPVCREMVTCSRHLQRGDQFEELPR